MKILLAIDESDFSQAAIQAVLTQARPQGTEVRIGLHVLEPPSLFNGARNVEQTIVEFDSPFWKALQEQAMALGGKIGGQTARCRFQCLACAAGGGDPKSKITDVYAKEWKADLIVLGSHGRKGLGRFLMGSVAESVARHAECSVEIVRIPGAK